ncbi:response regulator [Kineosporia mesophila]|uniref:Transcriptional regulatory protein n=1 Tax=Kineosporia mesophila TaxID=566012 RepID=A0ABP6Z926_9ACTN|nr:response regulator [Kineosporia mesophila]MCD5352724.1 response regulator [Kineosporia mesophila]
MPERRISTLIVDADPIITALHAQYVGQTPGFIVSGIANTGADMLRQTQITGPELILLDLNLPDASGLELCRILRARNSTADIMVITSSRNLLLVRLAITFGVVHYLLKPLYLQDFQEHLRRYAAFRRQTAHSTGPVSQRDIDSVLALLRPDVRADVVPTRLSARRTLDKVAAHLRTTPDPVSADEVAQALGISRVTARHYLEELTSRQLVAQTQRYGTSGRPRNLYRWHADQMS